MSRNGQVRFQLDVLHMKSELFAGPRYSLVTSQHFAECYYDKNAIVNFSFPSFRTPGGPHQPTQVNEQSAQRTSSADAPSAASTPAQSGPPTQMRPGTLPGFVKRQGIPPKQVHMLTPPLDSEWRGLGSACCQLVAGAGARYVRQPAHRGGPGLHDEAAFGTAAARELSMQIIPVDGDGRVDLRRIQNAVRSLSGPVADRLLALVKNGHALRFVDNAC